MGGALRGRKTTRGTTTRTRVAPRPSTHWKRASFIGRPSSERGGPGGRSVLRYPHIRLNGLWRKVSCEATHKCHIGLVTAVTGGEEQTARESAVRRIPVGAGLKTAPTSKVFFSGRPEGGGPAGVIWV